MIEATDVEKKLIKERFASRSQEITDEEAGTIVRTLKESRRWVEFTKLRATQVTK